MNVSPSAIWRRCATGSSHALRLVVLLCVALLGCGVSRGESAPVLAAGPAPPGALYLVRRGWHVDIAFATSQLPMPLASLSADLPGARYLVFGFGDRRYLLAPQRNTFNMIAALWPTPGLILVTGLTASPDLAFGAEHVIMLRVRPDQVRSAARLVWESLARDGTAPLAPGPYPGSRFYGAVVRYSAVNTCNTWVASILHDAGLAVHSRGVVFASQLWRQGRRIAHAEIGAQWHGGEDPSDQTAVEP